jgi:hypothetical protein
MVRAAFSQTVQPGTRLPTAIHAANRTTHEFIAIRGQGLGQLGRRHDLLYQRSRTAVSPAMLLGNRNGVENRNIMRACHRPPWT